MRVRALPDVKTARLTDDKTNQIHKHLSTMLESV